MCMKEFTKILSLFVLLFFFLCTSRLAAQQSAQSFDGSDLYAKYYLEHLPDDYNPNDGKRYPVLIALHGFGEGGNPSINSTKFLRSTGIPALIDNGSFPTSVTVNGKVFKFIVISPQLNQKNLSWYTPQVDYVVQQVKSIYANKADFQRIYLTGYSGGGAGVYTYPATATVLGNQIAAAVVCSGAAWYQNYTEISNIVNSSLPIWAFHNDGDPIVSLTSDQGWFYALNAAGINPKMKLTIYPNINQHDSWTRTYDPSQGNPNNIYQWMLQYSRPNIANPGTPAPPVPIASIPTAVAGNSQVITLTAGSTGSAVIDGSASSDAGGSIISYQWGKLSGPSGDQLISASQARTTINFNSPGNYTYQLTITDNQGNNSASRVSIQVNPAPIPVASIPTSVAGNSQVITLTAGSTGSAVIDGSASSDAGGSIISYQWGKLSGPSGDQLISASQARTTLNFNSPGNYIYQLTITDNQGNNSASRVGIQVNPAPIPVASIPTAVAGNDQQITLPGGSFTLNGTASKDAGGVITSYEWGKLSGPAGDQVFSSNQASTMVNVVNAGTYTYQLYITDNQGHSSASRMNVIVSGPQPVNPPSPLPQSILRANAGSEEAIILPGNAQLDALGSNDKNGVITGYQWSKLSGPSGDYITNDNQMTTSVNYSQVGSYTYSLSVTDDQGNQSSRQKTVIVYPAGTQESVPVADAGNNQNLTTSDVALLDGSQSYVNYARIIHVSWTKVSGPAGDMIGGNSHLIGSAAFINPGTYIYQIYIGDSQGNSGVSTVQINVMPSGNQDLRRALLKSNAPELGLLTMHGSGQFNFTEGLSVFPNPVITTTHLQLISSETGIVYMRVFDLSGRIVREQQINKSLSIVSSEVDLGSLSKGVYIIETTINNNRKSTKVLKY